MSRDPQGIRCNGTSKTGKPCTRWADFGYLQCHLHREDRKACTGTRQDGSACTRSPVAGTDNCYSHTPELVRAEQIAAKRCTATNRAGDPCTGRPVKGMDVCKTHGGATKAARRAAALRLEEEKARKALARMGKPVPVENALLDLQLLAGEVRQWNAFLREKVFQLKVAKWRYESQQGLEQVHGLIQLFERSQDRCQVTLSALARVQADERLAAIQEATLLMILSALQGAVSEAGLDTTVAAVIKTAFAKRVRVLKAGEVITGYKAIGGAKAKDEDEGKAA